MKPHAIISGLTHLLANTYILSVKLQNFHWHVSGMHFLTLHPFFGEQYETLFAYIDTIAERLRALGHKAPGRMKDYLDLKTLSESPETCPDAEGMLRILSEDTALMIRALHELSHLANDSHDEVTGDLCLEQQSHYERTQWMLRSMLG